jgi:hypothetical protein
MICLKSSFNHFDFFKCIFFISSHSTNIIGKQIKSSKSIEINNAKYLNRMTLFNKGTNILVTDYINGGLHILDLDCNYIRVVHQYDCLKLPSGICVQVKENGDEVIFVSDDEAKKVFLFDSSFKLIKTIGNDLNFVNYISVDSKNLYVSHGIDIVSIIYLNECRLITKLKIERPFQSTSDLNKLYIVSNFDGEWDEENRKVNKIKNGNYINIISKFNFNIIKKIQFVNWLLPRSIYLSNDGNIYTTAFELDNNNNYSKNKYLLQINKENNKIMNKIELNDIDMFYDSIYLNNKIILCFVNLDKGNEMRIIEFH